MPTAVEQIRNEGHTTRIGIRCMGAVRFESTDLDASEEFYRQSLDLEPVFRGLGPTGREEAVLRFPSGQLVIIERVDELGPRTGAGRWPGHHTALHIEPWDYKAADARIMAHEALASEISHGERYDRSVEAVYVHDPANNRLQISSYDSDTTNELPQKETHGAAIREPGLSPSERHGRG
ncbi:MAG: hypothetical protein HW416_1966 [Chloroflexi bacterium]|nr:hypothetical protein [Chloroflexota bacterium]